MERTSCWSTTRQMRNQILDVNEALTFTIINSRYTKLSQHNRRIVVGPLLQKSEEGIFWHTQLTWTRSFAILKCLNYVHEQDHHFGSCWSDGEGREDETNITCSQIYVSCDFPMVTWLWESSKIMGNKQLVHSKIRYICSSCTANIRK